MSALLGQFSPSALKSELRRLWLHPASNPEAQVSHINTLDYSLLASPVPTIRKFGLLHLSISLFALSRRLQSVHSVQPHSLTLCTPLRVRGYFALLALGKSDAALDRELSLVETLLYESIAYIDSQFFVHVLRRPDRPDLVIGTDAEKLFPVHLKSTLRSQCLFEQVPDPWNTIIVMSIYLPLLQCIMPVNFVYEAVKMPYQFLKQQSQDPRRIFQHTLDEVKHLLLNRANQMRSKSVEPARTPSHDSSHRIKRLGGNRAIHAERYRRAVEALRAANHDMNNNSEYYHTPQQENVSLFSVTQLDTNAVRRLNLSSSLDPSLIRERGRKYTAPKPRPKTIFRKTVEVKPEKRHFHKPEGEIPAKVGQLQSNWAGTGWTATSPEHEEKQDYDLLLGGANFSTKQVLSRKSLLLAQEQQNAAAQQHQNSEASQSKGLFLVKTRSRKPSKLAQDPLVQYPDPQPEGPTSPTQMIPQDPPENRSTGTVARRQSLGMQSTTPANLPKRQSVALSSTAKDPLIERRQSMLTNYDGKSIPTIPDDPSPEHSIVEQNVDYTQGAPRLVKQLTRNM